MKFMPLMAALNERDFREFLIINFYELEDLHRKGLRVPLGDADNPSISIGLIPESSGTGFFSLDGSYGLGMQGDLLQQRAVSADHGAALEVGPTGSPEPDDVPARLSVHLEDPRDVENFARGDLEAAIDGTIRVEAYKRGAPDLPDLVAGLDEATFEEAWRVAKESGEIRMGIQTGPTPNAGLDINTDLAMRESTPTPLSIDTHNYDFAGGNPRLVDQRVSATAPISLTGFAAGVEGERKLVRNIGPATITIPDDSGSSSAPNRVRTGSGGSIILAINQTLEIVYDAILQKWFAGPLVYTAGGAATTKESHVVLLATEPGVICS